MLTFNCKKKHIFPPSNDFMIDLIAEFVLALYYQATISYIFSKLNFRWAPMAADFP